MLHFKKLEEKNLLELKAGDYFTYETNINGKTYFKKGVKVGLCYMVPVGLSCESIESAKKQY